MGPFDPDSPPPSAVPYLGGEPEIGYILCESGWAVEDKCEGDGERRDRLWVCGLV